MPSHIVQAVMQESFVTPIKIVVIVFHIPNALSSGSIIVGTLIVGEIFNHNLGIRLKNIDTELGLIIEITSFH